jgi:P4 family phage/plasmid primase-like protien
MSFGGSGESAIHTTQLAVSASLLSKGHEVGEVVGLLLDATRAAAGDYGVRWNWRREEKSLRLMCEAWLRKHPAAPREAPTPQVRDAEGPAVAPSSFDGSTVVRLSASQAPRSTTNVIGSDGNVVNMGEMKRAVAAKKPADDGPDPIEAVVDGVIGKLAELGERLMLTEGWMWLYREGLWRQVDASDEQRLKVMIQEGFKALTVKAKMGSLAQAWKCLQERPSLYRHKVRWGEGKLVCANGALDIGSRTFEPHSPDHYARRKIGAPYEAGVACPQVVAHLHSLFAGREDEVALVNLLQEVTGAAIAPHLLGRAGRKAFLGYGASRAGKTEFSELIWALVCGEGSKVVSPAIRDLSGEFGLEPLLGASAWIRDDAINEGDQVDPQRFKVIVTGERVSVRRMRMIALETEFSIPVILTTNALPRVRDQTDALFNRCLVVPFDRVFTEEDTARWQEDHACPTHIRPIRFLFDQEAAGVLNWALEGLERLLARGGRYELPDAVREMMTRFKDENNPVQEFARRALRPDPGSMVLRADLMCAFHGWQKEAEGDEARAMGARAFFPRVRSAVSGSGDYQDSSGRRFLSGMRLTDEGLTLWQTHTEGPQLRGGARGASTDKPAVNKRFEKGKAGRLSHDEVPDDGSGPEF